MNLLSWSRPHDAQLRQRETAVHRNRPELTERPSGTHKRTRAEHIIAGECRVLGYFSPADRLRS